MEQAKTTAVLQFLSSMQLPEHFSGQPSLANIFVTRFASKSALKPTWQSLKQFSSQASWFQKISCKYWPHIEGEELTSYVVGARKVLSVVASYCQVANNLDLSFYLKRYLYDPISSGYQSIITSNVVWKICINVLLCIKKFRLDWQQWGWSVTLPNLATKSCQTLRCRRLCWLPGQHPF